MCRIWWCKLYDEFSVSWVEWVASDLSSCGVVNARGSRRRWKVYHSSVASSFTKGTESCCMLLIWMSICLGVDDVMRTCKCTNDVWNVSILVVPIATEATMDTPLWPTQLFSALFQSPPFQTVAHKIIHFATLRRKTEGIYLCQFGQNRENKNFSSCWEANHGLLDH